MSTFNKDNLTFSLFGILLGFTAGYFVHEVVVSRQPPRFVPTAAGQGAGMEAPAGPEAAPPAANASAVPPIQEIQQLRDFLRENPDNADAMRRLADLNFEMASAMKGDQREPRFWEEARSHYARYLELRPGDPDVLSDLGVTYRGLGQYDTALEQFDKALQADPSHWQSNFNKVVVLAFDQKKYDAAESILEDLKRVQPNNPDVARLAAEVDRQRNSAS